MTALHEITVGTIVPGFSRKGTFQHWNRFAAANYEFGDHHMDDDVGRREGFQTAVGMAPLLLSYGHTLLRDWIGSDARIVSVRVRVKSPFHRGRVATAGGEVIEIRSEEDETLVDVNLWIEDDLGARLVVGKGVVAYPKVRPS